jgi:short-subunit dehydrogenase
MKNKVVIITGASSGIGKALAQSFMRAEANVVLAARDSNKLQEIVQETKADVEKVLIVQTDVTNITDCKRLIENTIKKFGKIDILINNAGISMRAIIEKVNLDVIKRVMDVNFWGTVYCTKLALPYLIQSMGSVVGISVQGFLEVLRIENINKGLHVLIACPGFTSSNIRYNALTGDGSKQGESPRNEKKMMSPEKVAEIIVNAIKKRKHRIILTSQGKLTVLLNKFFPKLVDRMVFNHMSKEPDSPFN